MKRRIAAMIAAAMALIWTCFAEVPSTGASLGAGTMPNAQPSEAEGADMDPAMETAVANDEGCYRVYVRDTADQPVEGAVIQFCDETACMMQKTDGDGLAVFIPEEEKVYEVHALKLPEGFVATETVYRTLETCSDVIIVVDRAA